MVRFVRLVPKDAKSSESILEEIRKLHGVHAAASDGGAYLIKTDENAIKSLERYGDARILPEIGYVQ